MAFLRIIENASGMDWDVPIGGEGISLGSSGDNGVVLVGAEPRHLEIIPFAGGFKAVDRHTAMGTRVNGEWIIQKVLEHGDRILVGDHEIIFCAGDPAGSGGPGPQRRREHAASLPRSAAPPPAAKEPPDRQPPDQSPPSRRKRRYGPSAGPVTSLLFLAAAAALVFFAIHHFKGENAGDRPVLEKYAPVFEKAAAYERKGHFAAARELLKGIGGLEDPALAARVEKEKKVIARLEDLETQARERLAAIAAGLGRKSPEEIEGEIRRFQDRFGDLPFLEGDLDQLRLSLEDAREVRKAGFEILGREDALKRAGALLEAKDYSSALKVLGRFVPRDAAEREKKAARIAAVKTKAGGESRGLLAKASRLLEKNDARSVLDLLSESELARFKGTPLYDDLTAKASEAEKKAGLVPRRLRPGDLAGGEDGAPGGGKEGAGSGPAGSQEKVPVKPAGDRGAPGAASAEHEPSISGADLEEVDGAIRGWEFDKALSILQRLLKEARSREERNAVSTRIEFAYRQLWFLEDLELKLSENPGPALKTALKTRDGTFKGRFHSFVDSRVMIESADDIEGFPWEEIDPRGILNLARAYAPAGEERLNLACFCLNNGFKPEFETLAAAIREEGRFRRSIDSFLGMERGAPVTVDFGYHLLKGRLVPHNVWREAVLDKEIAVLKRKILSREPAVRNEGYRGFLDLGPVSFDALEEVLGKRYGELTDELARSPEVAGLEKVAAAKRRLNEARKYALELIFDSVRYFYPYKSRQGEYNKVQREVDARVEAVRKIWGDEFKDEVSGPKVKLSKKFLAARDDLNQVTRILGDITSGAFDPPSQGGVVRFLPSRGDTVTVRNFALDRAEWEIIDSSAAVMEYNETIDTSATRNEREQVWITNRYRMMMGRRALALNELILQAARSHSKWMSMTGVFSHFEDTPERRTPMDRMAQAGYDKGAGENIHMGAGSPMGAHLGWYHSSGHHRNMLAASHTEMACGVVGRYWTQNFGGGTEFSENLIRE